MSKRKYYFYLVFVILVWGLMPNLVAFYYKYMSAAVYSALTATISAISFTVMGWKKRNLLTRKSIKISLITGIFYALAIVAQMIGLQYTTPSMFAFLENTSCIVVPILMFCLLKKKPHPLVAGASVLCLVGCFVLNGADFQTSLGIGEVLCGMAGVFYAVNMFGTGTYAKEIPITLYLMIQKWVFSFVSVLIMLTLHFAASGGMVLEKMVFRWDPGVMLLLIVGSLVSGTYCWILRTEVTQNIDVTLVAIVMPLSAVITMVISALIGTDELSIHLVTGAGMILAASILSGVGNLLEEKGINSQNGIKKKRAA